MRLRIAHLVLDWTARMIHLSVLPERIQPVAWRFIQMSFPFLWAARKWRLSPGYRPDARAAMLNRMLCMFTRLDPDFTLHVELENASALMAAAAKGRGVLVCTGHQRLAFAAHRAILDLGIQPVFVGLTSGGCVGWNWGHPDPISTIDAERADVLLRCRARARQGNALVTFVDYYQDSREAEETPPVAISPNAFAWASNDNVPIVFLAARTARNGRIILTFREPDDLDAAPMALADAFARFLSEKTGWPCIVARRKAELRKVSCCRIRGHEVKLPAPASRSPWG